jgi:hypothetical protein
MGEADKFPPGKKQDRFCLDRLQKQDWAVDAIGLQDS